MDSARTLSRPILCYWLPLPWETAGVRGERRDWLPLPWDEIRLLEESDRLALSDADTFSAFSLRRP